MDLSTGGDIPRIRQAIIEESPVPDRHGADLRGAGAGSARREDLNIQVMLEVIEEQAQQGVDYHATIHAGVLVQYIPLTTRRVTGILSAGVGRFWPNGWSRTIARICSTNISKISA